MKHPSQSDYLLGVNQGELDRLRFQHSVWGSVTNKLFGRLNVSPGWKCLDVGSGPGFVAIDLRELVGASGEVSALEPSEFYLESFRAEVKKMGWTNIRFIQGTAEQSDLPRGHYDLVFLRWVLSFVTDPEQILSRLIASVRPGGIIAIQDYYYEGLSLFPRGGAFDRMPDVVRAHYRLGGGDPYVAGKIPAIFSKQNVRLVDLTPNCLAGGPESGIMEWAHRFFAVHTQAMVDRGIIRQQEGDEMLSDWQAHRNNPDALFFSPIVVDIAGAKIL